jgi:predicted MFS family arabinose efflux permease
VLIFAVLCFGFSLGAEGDIVGFLVARNFGVQVYSSVMGLMTMTISLAAATGAALLSLTLRLTGAFDIFLFGTAAATLVGSLMFLLLPKKPPEPEVEDAAVQPAGA